MPMLGLANQITGLLGTVLAAVVTALAVPDSVWKRRAIAAVVAVGAVQCVFLILTWEQQNNTAYLANALVAVWTFLILVFGNVAVQTLIVFAIGALGGWHLNELLRKRGKVAWQHLKRDKRLWRSGGEILEWARADLLETQVAATEKHNAALRKSREVERKKEEVLAGLGPYASLSSDPPKELPDASRATVEAQNEYARALEDYNRSETEILNFIYNGLETGRLIAKGFLPPFNHESVAAPIPAGQWRFLRFDQPMQNASGQGVTYIGVTVTDPKFRRKRGISP